MAAIPSPCIGLCRMNADSGLCLGGLRTLDEIGAWAASGDASRRRILAVTLAVLAAFAVVLFLLVLPIVIALNKVDLPGINYDRIYTQFCHNFATLPRNTEF